jgi:tetratricopeptide (TPR) repeat protein
MKSAVLTTVSAFVLASVVAASTLWGTDDADVDAMTTGSTLPVEGKVDRPVLTPRSIVLAQAETPVAPAEDAEDKAAASQVTVQPATVEAVPVQPKVDESALRYFARKGDAPRLAAEIARLRALYPDWTPPDDPLAGPETADRQLEAMWKLYAEGKDEDVRKEIARRQAAEAGWQPPKDLVDKLGLLETRRKLVAASEARRYDEVVDLGARVPGLLTCDDVDMLWRIADAFGNTARLSRALDAYGYILDNCTAKPERLATLMKASALLDYGQMQMLIAKEKTIADGSGEFEPIHDDLARRFVGEGGVNANLVVAPAYLERLRKRVASDAKAADALLLGWYYVKRKEMAEAGTFFRKAHDIEDTASAAQGLALTLISARKPGEAEAVMYRWRESSQEAWATYFAATANLLAIQPAPVIEADILARIAAAVTERREIRTAENFGWYALSYRQPRTAAQWFRTTLGWKPDYEPAAYGLTIARLRLKDMAGVRQMQKLWGNRSERIATLLDPRRKRSGAEDSVPSPDGVSPLADPGVDDYPTQSIDRTGDGASDLATRSIRRPVEAIKARATKSRARGCNSTVDPTTLSPGAALARGWCLMEHDRPVEAAAAFEAALGSPSPKARANAAYGQSLAYLRAGLVDQAAISATRAKQDGRRAVELQTSILSGRALNAFHAGHPRETLLFLDQLAQLQTERSDLMVLRAHAYRQLGRPTEARRLFEALAATGNRDAIKSLGEMQEDVSRR